MAQEQATAEKPDRRIVRRRALKKGVGIAIRKGTMGLGPNLSVGGVELSDDGIKVIVKSEMKKGDEIEIGLTGIGKSKAVVMIADVRWCRPQEEGETFVVGARFRRRIAYTDLGHYV